MKEAVGLSEIAVHVYGTTWYHTLRVRKSLATPLISSNLDHILHNPLGEPKNALEMCASWQCHHFWFIGVPNVIQERVLTLLIFPNYGP